MKEWSSSYCPEQHAMDCLTFVHTLGVPETQIIYTNNLLAFYTEKAIFSLLTDTFEWSESFNSTYFSICISISLVKYSVLDCILATYRQEVALTI